MPHAATGGNPRLHAIPPSQIRAIAARKRPSSIDLGLGEPTLLPQARFLERATAWASANGLRYTLNAGDPELRERIAAHYRYPGMSEAQHVCVTTGSQEAVYCTIKALLDPRHDELLVVEPAFPAYGKIAALEGIAVRTVGMSAETGFAFDVDAIVDAIRPNTRMIVVCSPCNPTGAVMTSLQARRLAEGIAAMKSGPQPLWVLHDEIYRELTYITDYGEIARFHPHTIAVNSLSKSNALTGLRIGWTIAPPAAADAILKTHAWVTSTASAFGQRVALEIFREPEALREQAQWYRDARGPLIEALRASGLRHVVPEGAFYAVVRSARPVDDDVDEAIRLIETRDVVTIAGSIFGATLHGWLRLSWVAPPALVAEGIARLAQ